MVGPMVSFSIFSAIVRFYSLLNANVRYASPATLVLVDAPIGMEN